MRGLFKVVSGVVVWLVMSYIGASYFLAIADYFAISGFVLMILIIYYDKWYPRFRRWRSGV